jgi:hypothetical protein
MVPGWNPGPIASSDPGVFERFEGGGAEVVERVEGREGEQATEDGTLTMTMTIYDR